MFVIRKKNTGDYLGKEGRWTSQLKRVRTWKRSSSAYDARYRISQRSYGELELADIVVEEIDGLEDLRRWLGEGVNESGEPCAYPNDKNQQHDHEACLDAFQEPRFFGLTDAELKGIQEDEDPGSNESFRDLAAKMSKAVRFKPQALGDQRSDEERFLNLAESVNRSYGSSSAFEIMARGALSELSESARHLGTRLRYPLDIKQPSRENPSKGGDARQFVLERTKEHQRIRQAVEAVERFEDKTSGRSAIVDVDEYCECLEICAQRMSVSAAEFGMFSRNVLNALIVSGRRKEAQILGIMARFVADYREITS